jgi:hypothetical protein
MRKYYARLAELKSLHSVWAHAGPKAAQIPQSPNVQHVIEGRILHVLIVKFWVFSQSVFEMKISVIHVLTGSQKARAF